MTSTTAVQPGGAALPFLLPAALAGVPGSPPGAGKSTSTRAGGAAGAGAASKAGAGKAAAKTATKKASTTTAKKASSTTAKKATTAKATGYATNLPADAAFLRDPKLTIEEKLSRFIGLLMAKSEQDLLRQMEKMAPGSTAGAPGTAGAAAAKPAAKKVSIWSLVKTILPPLGMASQLVGDATLKKLVQQLSGPVLGAAATALGGPALGALASQLGPAVGELVTRDVKVDLSGLASLVGLDGGAKASSGTGAGGSSTAAGGTTAKASGAAEPATSEKAQLMELQRLQDRDKELFALFSNMLRSMHDARMTSIQNIR